MKNKKGFTLIELLVVIGIIGVIAGIMVIAIAPVRGKARDAKRKQDLVAMGQFLYSSSCYQPDAGAGDYDLADLVPELVLKYPQYASYTQYLPKDPKTGTDAQTNYHYEYLTDGHCRVYANLENENEPLGANVISGTAGWNGTSIYYQIVK